MMKRVLFVLMVAAVFACSERDDAPQSVSKNNDVPRHFEGPPIILSILPVERAGAMYERFLPLRYYLENALKRPVILKVAKDYETAILEIGSGGVHMAYLDPATYCEVRARYKDRVIPLVRAHGKEVATSRSVLVTKTGGVIEKAADLKGKRLALGNQQSSFSYLIPLSMLHDVGLGIKDFSSVDFLNQEDRVALSVLIGNHDVGGISESVARRYLDEGLKILKKSEAIPQFFLCASDVLPHETREDIIKTLTVLTDRGVLSTIDKDMEGFIRAEDRDFDVVRVMIRNLTGRDYIEYGPKTVRVAILPLYSAITIYERYEPLMRYLSQKTGYEFKLVIPKTFEDFMEVVKGGTVDFSYQNPYIFALISKEMDIKPLVTTVGEDCASEDGICGEDRFRGIIITRHDSGIRDIRDLKNKRVFIVSPKSAGGYLSQRLFLKERGIDTERDLKVIDVKKQERVILGVYRGEADAGFVRESAPIVWREEVDMQKIRILARTNYLPNWPFAACRDTNPRLTEKVKTLLTDLNDREILRTSRIKGFKVAHEEEFEALKKY